LTWALGLLSGEELKLVASIIPDEFSGENEVNYLTESDGLRWVHFSSSSADGPGLTFLPQANEHDLLQATKGPPALLALRR
jgi:hypothetical protein